MKEVRNTTRVSMIDRTVFRGPARLVAGWAISRSIRRRWWPSRRWPATMRLTARAALFLAALACVAAPVWAGSGPAGADVMCLDRANNFVPCRVHALERTRRLDGPRRPACCAHHDRSERIRLLESPVIEPGRRLRPGVRNRSAESDDVVRRHRRRAGRRPCPRLPDDPTRPEEAPRSGRPGDSRSAR